MSTATADLQTLNPRVAAMHPSATLAISARAAAMRQEGRPVIALSAGEPDFITPKPILEAAHEALRAGHTHYTPNAGIPELREAIARKLNVENGIDVSASQVLCCTGAKQAIAQTILATCAPGDEVVIPAPYWVSYPEMARLAGADPVVVKTTAAAGYKMSPQDLEAALTEHSRLLILTSPSNPTGAVYTSDELHALAEIIAAHPRLLVASDEIYEYVIFDAEHVSIATCPGMAERTSVVNGFSKGFAMTGWRLGYLAAPLWITEAASKIQSQLTSAPNSITQHAALTAFTMPWEPIATMVADFRKRRDAVLSRLLALPGVECPTPQGAFYLFPDVSALYNLRTPSGKAIKGSQDLCAYLLEQAEVALVPGAAFGEDRGLRLSYATDLDTLTQAMARIEHAVDALS